MNQENHRPKPRQMMGIATLLALLTITGGCGASGDGASEETSAERHEEGEEVVRFTAEELDEFEIKTGVAASGMLELTSTFPGEVRVNEDQFVHIVPRVSGVVHSVYFSEGDSVKAGQILAVLDSEELADMNSEYLASIARAEIAELNFRREETLYGQKISSEAEFLTARTHVTEATIKLNSVRQKLLALGFSEEYIRALPSKQYHALVHYEVTAPMDGLILERHISRGEAVESNADAFAIARLSTVWVDLEVFQKDLDLIKEGQEVQLLSSGSRVRDSGSIRFVRPVVGEETRTAIARIVLDNATGKWRPGMFVTGRVIIEKELVNVYVPRSSLVVFEGKTVIFSEYEDGFTPREVTLGRESSTHVEILSGLEPDQKYVYDGAFALKAQLAKSELDEGH